MEVQITQDEVEARSRHHHEHEPLRKVREDRRSGPSEVCSVSRRGEVVMEVQITQDEVEARSHGRRGSAKLRFAVRTAVLAAVVCIGWVSGVLTRESTFAQASSWFRQTASAVTSKFDGWREPTLGSDDRNGVVASESIQTELREQPDATIVFQRMTDGLNTRMDQLRASSDEVRKQLGSRIDQVNGSVERSQRELLAKLDQLQKQLKSVENQAMAAAVGIKKVQSVATSKSTPQNRGSPPRPSEASEFRKVGRWSVWEVVDGTAILEGPEGFITVSTGDLVPGAGRVEAIVRRDGRWVVSTTQGVISNR